MKHLDIVITGKVQGVGFRQATKMVANQLSVMGTVKNQKDGSVAIEAEADGAILELFLDFFNEGPDYAQIESLESHEGEVKNYRNFEILRRGL
ncbi:acylphosphatase [Mucilaginibacter myungsuensis]|uniref:acylphosphatase n=1 Tax=Mucilaginibacter myungsuensis TaxID=649104 RepID=A0A929PXL4_9SPHI|nr:acylphosphatase [Mucilaginibacter myungsuensis]MBE9663274.1 acylphosphatase [Mucilaginibacter myungsuensis]MDN3600009.1 acylphosphatase [Mucilaginibacter myungsuensis]